MVIGERFVEAVNSAADRIGEAVNHKPGTLHPIGTPVVALALLVTGVYESTAYFLENRERIMAEWGRPDDESSVQ